MTNLKGIRMISSYRADTVPPEAITWITAHAKELLPNALVGGDSAAASTLMGGEFQRESKERQALTDFEAKQKRAQKKTTSDQAYTWQPAPPVPLPFPEEIDLEQGSRSSETVPELGQ
jgi:hypothetical protein